MANLTKCADDVEKRAFTDKLAEIGETPIDLVSDDEDFQGQGTKRGRSGGEAPCDEEAPRLKRGTVVCPWGLRPPCVPPCDCTSDQGGGPKTGGRASNVPKTKSNADIFA